jgi:hypothetical protein
MKRLPYYAIFSRLLLLSSSSLVIRSDSLLSKLNSVALVHRRTIPTEWPPLVG